jgi:polyisoprenoid-binding protein YceI
MNALLTALALLSAASPGAQVLDLDARASTVRFQVEHKLHKVDGLSHGAEGKAVLDADGGVRTMVRIPVQSFESGDANRDSHMLETLEAGRFPYVVFKGVGALAGAAPGGKPVELRLRGELEFHGVKRPVEVPVTVELGRDGSARVRGTLTVSLDAHGVERPSLLFVKLEDACTIAIDLKLGRAG